METAPPERFGAKPHAGATFVNWVGNQRCTSQLAVPVE
jgi:hypothetical protein